MKTSWIVFVGVTLTLIIGGINTAMASVIAPGAQLQKLVTGFSFTEGPAVDAEGNLFFTDQPNDRIMKWDTTGTLSVFLTPCGRANGLFFDREGNLWACADEHNELWRIDPNGTVTVVINNYNGKLLNGPNDLWIMRTGGIYITDPYFQRSYWNRGPMEQSGQHVFYLAPDQQILTQVTSDLQQPNGIIGTPDGRFLYVADYGAKLTWRYTVQPDGTLAEKTLFCSQGSDGMTLDQEGNLYLTGTGVTVYNRSGQKIETISVPEGTANVTFGGVDRKTLIITAGTSVYTLKMNVQGASLQPDFNADEHVNFLDYARLAQSWNIDDPNVDLGPATLGDCIIDMRDVRLLADDWLGEILPVGLKAYWKLDEPNGAVASDSVESFDAAVAGNMIWQPEGGMAGGALEFDGISDYVSTPYVLNPANGAFSAFAWVLGAAPGRVILSQKGNKNLLSADPSSGYLKTELKGNGRGAQELVSQTVITDGNWHHIGIVWDGTYRTLYVDGDIAATDASSQGNFTSSTNGLYIGAGKGLESGSFWSGLIDDVRLYNRAVVPK